jgi:beta-galactosidase
MIIDMMTAHPIVGFTYLPRQDGPNGHVKDWEFYESDDGLAWGQAVKTGTFPDGTALQTVTF